VRDALDVLNDARTPVAADAAQPVVAASMTVEPAPPSDQIAPLPSLASANRQATKAECTSPR